MVITTELPSVTAVEVTTESPLSLKTTVAAVDAEQGSVTSIEKVTRSFAAFKLKVEEPAGPLLAIVIELVKYTLVELTSVSLAELTMMFPEPAGASETKLGRLVQV